MISQKKVELMTRMAMYENKSRAPFIKQALPEKNFRLAIALRSMPVGLVIGVLAGFIACMAQMDRFLFIYERLGIGLTAVIAALGVCVIAAVYVLVSTAVLGRKYENMHGTYVKLGLYRSELAKFMEEE